MKEDIEKYNEGIEIARQLSELLKKDNSQLHDYPKIENWLRDNKYSSEVIHNITHENTLHELYDEFNLKAEIGEANRIIEKIERIKARRRKIQLFAISSAAVIGALFFIVWTYPKVDDRATITSQKMITTKKVNFDFPTLILNDGKNINLTSSDNNITISSDLTIKNQGRKLEYNTTSAGYSNIDFNTLVVPKMFTYTLKLQDGTEVHLNANSELRYPVKFDGHQREVYLKGEAYFNVAKSNKPFIVKGDNSKVIVYGTKFNINLRDKNYVQTVLEQGSVGISIDGMEGKEVILKPNQMSTLNKIDGQNNVISVDCSRYTAWTTGYFRCDTEQLTTLLENISNWFNVSFEYNDESIHKMIVSASINMNKSIDEILKLVEIISDVKFVEKGGGAYIIESIK